MIREDDGGFEGERADKVTVYILSVLFLSLVTWLADTRSIGVGPMLDLFILVASQ